MALSQSNTAGRPLHTLLIDHILKWIRFTLWVRWKFLMKTKTYHLLTFKTGSGMSRKFMFEESVRWFHPQKSFGWFHAVQQIIFRLAATVESLSDPNIGPGGSLWLHFDVFFDSADIFATISDLTFKSCNLIGEHGIASVILFHLRKHALDPLPVFLLHFFLGLFQLFNLFQQRVVVWLFGLPLQHLFAEALDGLGGEGVLSWGRVGVFGVVLGLNWYAAECYGWAHFCAKYYLEQIRLFAH